MLKLKQVYTDHILGNGYIALDEEGHRLPGTITGTYHGYLVRLQHGKKFLLTECANEQEIEQAIERFKAL